MQHTDEDLRHALSLMETALSVLDQTDATADIGAHLDLAIERLKTFLGSTEVSGAEPFASSA
jgi:hypothetical protein